MPRRQNAIASPRRNCSSRMRAILLRKSRRHAQILEKVPQVGLCGVPFLRLSRSLIRNGGCRRALGALHLDVQFKTLRVEALLTLIRRCTATSVIDRAERTRLDSLLRTANKEIQMTRRALTLEGCNPVERGVLSGPRWVKRKCARFWGNLRRHVQGRGAS